MKLMYNLMHSHTERHSKAFGSVAPDLVSESEEGIARKKNGGLTFGFYEVLSFLENYLDMSSRFFPLIHLFYMTWIFLPSQNI